MTEDVQKQIDDLNARLAAEENRTRPVSRNLLPWLKALFAKRPALPTVPTTGLTTGTAMKATWAAWVTASILGISIPFAGLSFQGCNPLTPPGPLPSGENRLLVVVDESSPMTPDTLSALYSEDVWLYAGASLADGPEGTKEGRIFDESADVSQEHPAWQEAMTKAKGKKLPYVAISGKIASYSGDLPAGKTEMVALLKKCFGGAKMPPPVRGPPMMVGAAGADPEERKATTGYVKGKGLTSKGNYATFDMKLMSDSEIEAAIVRKNADKSWLSDIRTRGNRGSRIPSRDQNGKGYCWAHSSVWALIINRAKNNQPYADLSPFAVACKIKDFRDEGGWGSESLDFLVKNGCPSSKFWPQQSMLRSNDNAQTWGDAAKHKVTEFVALSSGSRDMPRQMATCLCNNIPVVTDLNWWGHSICTVRLKSWGPNGSNLVTTIQNSWSDSWGSFGEGDLKGSQAIPDDAVAPRVANGSFAARKHESPLYAQAP